MIKCHSFSLWGKCIGSHFTVEAPLDSSVDVKNCLQTMHTRTVMICFVYTQNSCHRTQAWALKTQKPREATVDLSMLSTKYCLKCLYYVILADVCFLNVTILVTKLGCCVDAGFSFLCSTFFYLILTDYSSNLLPSLPPLSAPLCSHICSSGGGQACKHHSNLTLSKSSFKPMQITRTTGAKNS